MLITLLLVPLIGSIIIMMLPEKTEIEKTKIKTISILTTGINLILSLILWLMFDSNTILYQFVYEITQIGNLQINVGVDGISLYFVLLTTFVTPIALLANYQGNYDSITPIKYFYISFLVLETLQIFAFTSMDLLLFYIFFESVLPVLFIILILYGVGDDRERSAYLLFLYTLAGSLPMLLCILVIKDNVGSTDFQFISFCEIAYDSQIVLWIGFFLAFAVKTPLYPFTLWLPRAHADSPLAGSIILAATILKLATYGYIRVLINYLPDACNFYSPLVQTFALIAIIYASLTTIIQQDTKRLIAYSSIAHMGVIVLGIFSNTVQGLEGAILFAIAHGFVSPALFVCVGGIIYERTGTRIILYMRGLVTHMPIFAILFLYFILANTGIPFTVNFIGEQLSLLGMFTKNPLITCASASGIVLSACYSIFLFNRIIFGSFSKHILPVLDIQRREFNSLFSFIIPVILFGIFPNNLLDTIHSGITTFLYNFNTLFFPGFFLFKQTLNRNPYHPPYCNCFPCFAGQVIKDPTGIKPRPLAIWPLAIWKRDLIIITSLILICFTVFVIVINLDKLDILTLTN